MFAPVVLCLTVVGAYYESSSQLPNHYFDRIDPPNPSTQNPQNNKLASPFRPVLKTTTHQTAGSVSSNECATATTRPVINAQHYHKQSRRQQQQQQHHGAEQTPFARRRPVEEDGRTCQTKTTMKLYARATIEKRKTAKADERERVSRGQRCSVLIRPNTLLNYAHVYTR